MKRLKLTALLLAFIMILAACGGGAKQPAQTPTQTDETSSIGAPTPATGERDALIVAVAADATGLDPIDAGNIYAENIIFQLYDTLMVLDDGNPVPGVAESVEQTGDVDFTVTLRKDVTFHNGDPLTSADVQFTLERAASSAGYGYIFGNIDETTYQTPDERTLKFSLRGVDASFLAALSHPAASIVSKKAIEAGGDNYPMNPVGTGPFKMESWTKLDKIVLTRNDAYWGTAPAFKTMELRVIPEGTNRTIELESGGVDIALEIPAVDIPRVDEAQKLQLVRKTSNSVNFIGFNVAHEPLNNVKVRDAISYAIDSKAIVASVLEGTGQVATGPINPNIKYSIAKDLPSHEYSPEKAKTMLEEAGVKNLALKLYVSEDQTDQDIATIVQAQLKEVGITVEVTPFEWGVYLDTLRGDAHDMFVLGWVPSIPDAHYYLYSPFHTANMGQGPNFGYYTNTAIDALIDQGKSEVDDAKRGEIYKNVQDAIIADIPWIYTYNGEHVAGAQDYVQNFELNSNASHPLYKVTFK